MSDEQPAVRFFFEEDGEWTPGVSDTFIGQKIVPEVGDVVFGLNASAPRQAMRVVSRWFTPEVHPTWWLLTEPANEPEHAMVLSLQDEVDGVFAELRRADAESTANRLRVLTNRKRRRDRS